MGHFAATGLSFLLSLAWSALPSGRPDPSCVAVVLVFVEPPTTQPASQPARHLIVEGIIFDHIGAGIQGVQVEVFVPADGERPKLASTTTGDTGEFRIHHTHPLRGKLSVIFTKPGYRAHTVEVEADPDGYPPYIDHQMQGALDLRGIVQNRLGDRPVTGAKVVVQAAYTEWSAVSDDAGRFEVKGLPPDGGRITIEAEGYARLVRILVPWTKPGTQVAGLATSGPGWMVLEVGKKRPSSMPTRQVVEVSPSEDVSATQPAATTGPAGPAPPSESTLTFGLEPERVVHLTVADDNGQPVPQVVVEALVEATGDFRSGATDTSGRCTFRGLSLESTQVAFRLTHPEHVSSTSFDRRVEVPADQAESSHTLVLDTGAVIRGKVTQPDGRLLGGARLMVGRSADEPVVVAWSELDGAFALRGVPPGEAIVTVHLAEHAPRLFVVTADPKNPTTLEVVLSPAAQLGGQVMDVNGLPVFGAYVIAGNWRGYETLGLRALTDSDGRFLIRDAPPEEFVVSLYAPGFKPLEKQTVQGGKTDLRFQFTDHQAGPESPSTTRLQAGQTAPAFEATTLEGRKIQLTDFKGQYLFIDFWATWCGPCVLELPNVLALHKALGSRKDSAMLGVSLDSDEKALRKFVEEKKLAWPQVFGEPGGAKRLAEQFGVGAIPSTFLIGPDGQIIATDLAGPQLTERVRAFLDQKAE